MKRTMVAALSVVLVCGLPATARAADRERLGDVQEALDALARRPGVLAAIGEARVDGRLVGRGSAGSRLRDGKGGKVSPDARYRAGSQTKLMIGVAVLQLVKEGRIGLDDTLSELLPAVAGDAVVKKADEITLRQLLRHTSGIPDWSVTMAADPDRYLFTNVHRDYRPLEVVKMSSGLPRTGAPGERFSYSNTNYTLLGMIVEKVTGRSLPGELDRRVFRPLGMTRSYLSTAPGIKGRHAHSYVPDRSGRLRDVTRQNPSFGGAAGGVVSTARDLSAFARAYLRGTLLPPELMKVLTDPPEGVPTGPQEKCDVHTNAGSFPGYISATVSSKDGRRQFALSVTFSGPDKLRGDALSDPEGMRKAAAAVLCP
ncbi:serine hydrolase domain-containing protein [Nonomuraea sp. NPDC050547]|uniref:serine hydrolase domain-containing protein n=1 Tax=Nonomuraea sp. NPDC050547 TaxID=3364368 RepID=UPI0037AA9A95